MERHNIILSHDGTPFLYIDEVTDTLSELSISAGELVTLFFGDPSRIFKRALAAVIPSGRRIEFVRAGDAVERSFNSLDVRDKVAVSLRAARRAVEGRDKSSVWDDTEHLLDACEVSLVLGATIDKDALGPATEVTPRFLASNNRYVDPASVLGELYGLIAVCSGESNDLHYPLLILKPFASCEPVYVGIAKDIALLDRLRRGNATGDSQQARIALLELPL